MCKLATANINGFSMNYAVFGHGPNCMALIPGLSVTPVTPLAEAVARQYATLADSHTVYVLDRRSHPPQGYTMHQMAKDTLSVLHHIGVDQFTAVGMSQGGMIAQYMAALAPERVTALVVVSASMKPTQPLCAWLSRCIQAAQSGNTAALAVAFAESVYSDNTLRTHGEQLRAAGEAYTAEQLAEFVCYAKALLDFDLENQIENITCPAVVIGARGDRIFGAESPEKLARKLRCPLKLYGEEYGHAVYDETPDFVAYLREWLTSVR